MNTIVECIKEIKNEIGGYNWRVCFIPASTHHKTACRYQKLATFIEKETGIACDYHTILPKPELITQHMATGKTNPAEDFLFNKEQIEGKDIILIGDIITTGTNFTKTSLKLAEAIQAAGYKVAINAIYNEHDHEAGHLTGKTGNPIEGFGFNASDITGKKIIVIDDIITRGRTFQMVAEKLETMGAASVTGLFLAKTFNPDYHPYYDPTDDYEPEDYYDPSDYYEEEETYDNYNGSYAQDVEGWSDQDIDDVFDGDPDAYWNID